MNENLKIGLEALAHVLIMVIFYVGWHEGGHLALYAVYGCDNIHMELLPLGLAAAADCETSTFYELRPFLAIQEIINYCILPYVLIGLLIYYVRGDKHIERVTKDSKPPIL